MRLNTIELSRPSASSGSTLADADGEQAIMAQIDTLYSVALRYTGDERLAGLLTEKTVMAALRDRLALTQDGRAIKPVMLSLLRSMYLKTRAQPAC